MYLLVGLGNPGMEYAFTRHNVGFRVIDELARRCAVKLKEVKDETLLAQASLAGKRVVLACPLTYMNRSGVAVNALLRRFSLGAEDLLVFYDDMDLPLGRLRLRPGGGSGGHRGMESLIAMLGTDNFPRLRLGVGRDAAAEGEEVARYLLTPFSAAEELVVQDAVLQAAGAAELFLRQGIDAAMNRYNVLRDK
ncbi:MAG: aminoacyl-tRNA hydrolase [Bacillota bacterium]